MPTPNDPFSEKKPCPDCTPPKSGKDVAQELRRCDRCRGTGWINE